MPIKPISARTMTTAYVLALLIIAGLSIASHVALEASLQTNEGSAAVINRSGRQRMLSQRITALAYQWKSGDKTIHEDLRDATNEFETSHNFLTRTLRTEVSSDNDVRELQNLYFGDKTSLDFQIRHFVADARLVAGLEPNDPRLDQPLSRISAQAHAPLLTALNNVVTIEQRRSESRITHLERLQWSILAIVLFTLMIEASFIFRPLIRRIIAYTGELSRLATTDPLTGIANRRSFLERSEKELARVVRHTRPASILIIDVDHFKAINDTFGHPAGDEVLSQIGSVFRQTLRQIDIFGRLGGEEFAVLLVETALPDAVIAAERLRVRMETMKVSFGGLNIKITVSIGCMCLDKEAARLEDALSLADQLMYVAKQTGRNRVVSDLNLVANLHGSSKEDLAAAT
jgi:diguanylate cyclase (GGDEF)-like protein